MRDIDQKLIAGLGHVDANVPLAKFTRIRIGGPARFFITAGTAGEVEQASQVSKDLGIPVFILGGGSNVLVSDQGFSGLVIRCSDDQIQFEGTMVTVGAGFFLSRLAVLASQRGLSGLEFALGLPGTVGGAIFGNAAAFDGSMAAITESVTILDHDGHQKQYSNGDMEFGYRRSILGTTHGIVLAASLRLRPCDKQAILADQKKWLAYRKEHQPIELPTLGSTFRNIARSELSDPRFGAKLGISPEAAQHYIGAGQLLDSLGMKGFRIGDAQISEKHANFIVNCGSATAEQVVMLISVIKQKIRVAFGGLQLQEEIQYCGFEQP